MPGFAWLGDPGESSAVVVCRTDTAGQLTVSCNGATFTGENITEGMLTTHDGVGKAAITGLTPGAEYEALVYVGGVHVDTVYPRTLPTSGVLRIAQYSCIDQEKRQNGLMHLNTMKPHLVLEVGDTPYADNGTATGDPKTIWGVSIVSCDYDTSEANYCAQFRAFMLHPDLKELHRRSPVYRKANDHEIGNNWDHTLAQCNDNSKGVLTKCGISPNTPAEVYARAMVANDAYAAGNPSVSPRYFSKVAGPVEIFSTDDVTDKDPIIQADDANKRMIGVAQESWLLAGLSACKVAGRHAIISSGYNTAVAGSYHSDAWASYQTQLARIKQYIVDNAIPCFWITGDHHNSKVIYSETPWHLDILGCGVGGTLQDDGTGYLGERVWKSSGYTGTPSAGRRAFCVVDVDIDNSKIYPRIVDEFGNEIWGNGIYIPLGANELIYPTMKFG